MSDVRNNETASNDSSPDETRSIFQPDCQHQEGTDKNSLQSHQSSVDNKPIAVSSDECVCTRSTTVSQLKYQQRNGIDTYSMQSHRSSVSSNDIAPEAVSSDECVRTRNTVSQLKYQQQNDIETNSSSATKYSAIGPTVTNHNDPKVKGRLSKASPNRIGHIITKALRPVEVVLESMDQDCDSFCAYMKNFEYQRWNGMVLDAPCNFKNPSLTPLLKTKNGFGPGLPRYPIAVKDIPKNAPYAAGSRMPPRLFPTFRMFQMISYKRLSLLAAIYNNDFGIVANDDLLVCRRKFERFISI